MCNVRVCDYKRAAADPASSLVAFKYDASKVSTHVTSQTKRFPFDQDARVTPSKRLPSSRERPIGSRVKLWPADVKAR